MSETIPARIRLADNVTVPLAVGTEIFNYYDMKAGYITGLPTRSEPDTSGIMPDGKAWWCETTTGTIDGSRMCTLETAREKGWL